MCACGRCELIEQIQSTRRVLRDIPVAIGHTHKIVSVCEHNRNKINRVKDTKYVQVGIFITGICLCLV